jgi:hypothetical protein
MRSINGAAAALLLIGLSAVTPVSLAERYDLVIVGTATGSAVDSATGWNAGIVTSTGLNVPDDHRLTDRAWSIYSADAGGNPLAGQWSFSNGAGDSLFGTFSATALAGGTPSGFQASRYLSQATVTGGTGYYASVQGGDGTLETYLWSNGRIEDSSFYDGVSISRLSVDAQGATLATDGRGASVLALAGREFYTQPVGSGYGSYSGNVMSVPPSAYPMLTFESGSYTFVAGVDGSAGSFLDVNAGADSLSGNFVSGAAEFLSAYGFYHGHGTSAFTGGTGAYAGTSGDSEYEFFSRGTGIFVENGFDFQEVVVSRVALVPEPETYALLPAGLGLVAFALRRRRLV